MMLILFAEVGIKQPVLLKDKFKKHLATVPIQMSKHEG